MKKSVLRSKVQTNTAPSVNAANAVDADSSAATTSASVPKPTVPADTQQQGVPAPGAREPTVAPDERAAGCSTDGLSSSTKTATPAQSPASPNEQQQQQETVTTSTPERDTDPLRQSANREAEKQMSDMRMDQDPEINTEQMGDEPGVTSFEEVPIRTATKEPVNDTVMDTSTEAENRADDTAGEETADVTAYLTQQLDEEEDHVSTEAEEDEQEEVADEENTGELEEDDEATSSSDSLDETSEPPTSPDSEAETGARPRPGLRLRRPRGRQPRPAQPRGLVNQQSRTVRGRRYKVKGVQPPKMSSEGGETISPYSTRLTEELGKAMKKSKEDLSDQEGNRIMGKVLQENLPGYTDAMLTAVDEFKVLTSGRTCSSLHSSFYFRVRNMKVFVATENVRFYDERLREVPVDELISLMHATDLFNLPYGMNCTANYATTSDGATEFTLSKEHGRSFTQSKRVLQSVSASIGLIEIIG